MSYHEYLDAVDIMKDDYHFDSIIMAAYMRADSGCKTRLRMSFPSLCAEADARFGTPSGALPNEHYIRERVEKRASQNGQAQDVAASSEATGP